MVIRKFVMHSRQLNLRHVAGDAVPLCHRASSSNRIRGGMARLALGVIRRAFVRHSPVHIVACRAADPSVGGIIATASCQAIELIADIGNSSGTVGRNIPQVGWHFVHKLASSSVSIAASLGMRAWAVAPRLTAAACCAAPKWHCAHCTPGVSDSSMEVPRQTALVE